MNKSFDRVDWEPKHCLDDEVLCGLSIRKSITGDYINELNCIEITVNDDGAIFFSGDGAEDFIYFYPSQLKHLRDALKVALRQERESRKTKTK